VHRLGTAGIESMVFTINLLYFLINNLSSNKLLLHYILLLQLNIDRGTKRRKPNIFTSVLEPFNDNLFNFTKVNPGEYLFKFNNLSSNNSSGK